ncbi:T9SS type A sorting domain-containing protein [Flagellimonas sp.]|uniref:T9SS type A sorting domain-containing protein n=1 Tax=Flagellimonas sp. TaxID=2058762 RepID=UPI003B520902
MKKVVALLFLAVIAQTTYVNAQHSVAREWNEAVLSAIREDIARPTVHARNLFHSSMIMYDAWALFDDTAETVFLGKTLGGYICDFEGINIPTDAAEIQAARHEIISYGVYRLLTHRFANSPGATESLEIFDNLLAGYGYDASFDSVDYSNGSFAALGNYLASQMIAFGLQDGSNEQNGYGNQFYDPTNAPLILETYEETYPLTDPNRWQPLAFDVFIGQAGNVFPDEIPDFLSPEWGQVTPFSLVKSDLEMLNNGFDSYVYNDPGHPVYMQASNEDGIDDPYKWHFALVASWSSHLDPADPTLIDISPGALGNVDLSDYPETFEEYQAFYDFVNGGDPGTGHALNPVTNAPYTPQLVKRADYARVLAEFWADGPDSETPPGHWFTILNYVNDHPETIKQFEGQGAILDDLEWDVKAYLALGGAMHDSAVNTWGVKGYYDYIRPISAIRHMAGNGQSSNAALPSYDPFGIPLIPGLIELVEVGDPLAGDNNENVGRIKIFAWKGPDFITDPTTDVAGVDWILGTQWWPYQRATFVTPPFAGYVSGHSTFSRAAAEVLTMFTGDAFFPGGMGVFDAEQGNFLVFENGPSENLTLQWATYRDASDQTSLSRIWGGIHPPIDDIRGRIIGDKIGKDAFALAKKYFEGAAIVENDNFEVVVSGESCAGQANGSIQIVAKSNFQYQANMDGNTYNFANEILVENVANGTHNLCITIESDPNFEQCFQFEVEAAVPIDGLINVENTGGVRKAQIHILEGTAPYTVRVNDQFVGEFALGEFEVPVGDGDALEIETSMPCEGKLFEKINGSNLPLILFPNPTNDTARIWIAEQVTSVEVDIFNAHGQKVSSKIYDINNQQLELSTSGLPSGIYYVQLHLAEEKTLKMIKI